MALSKIKGFDVVSQARANAKCAIIVCALKGPSVFADNVFTVCADCGADVMHRPHAPPARKICMKCAAPHIAAATQRGKPVNFTVTEQSAGEVILALGKMDGSA